MKIVRWLPAFLWLVVISYLSFSSLEKIPVPQFFSADKIGHFGMYFILELLFLIPLKGNNLGFRLATLGAILFSASTEFIQHWFVTNRYGEFSDFLANVMGICAAFFLLKNRINI